MLRIIIKKQALLIFILGAIWSSCGLKEAIGPVSGTSSSDSYQPTTSGSTWKYDNQIIGIGDEDVTIKITGATAIFNNKTYYAATSTTKSTGTSTGYFYTDGTIYNTRTMVAQIGSSVELQYLDISKSTGGTWTNKVNDSGYINGISGRFLGTMAEKGISKTIGGKTFTNVIHTTIELQYDYGLGAGFETVITYQYYLAKGVGLIEIDSNVYGIDAGKETIVSYDVK